MRPVSIAIPFPASLLAALAVFALLLTEARGQDVPWKAKGGGHVLLIRHAIAPGTGDPPQFKLGDCSTQRNLSEEGREQARRIGVAIRRTGLTVHEVLSSRWCRAEETARELGLGPVKQFPALDSFFSNAEAGPGRVAGMAEAVAAIGDRNVVMVTHQVNVTGLTGVVPASGEVVVVRPRRNGGGVEIVARFRP